MGDQIAIQHDMHLVHWDNLIFLVKGVDKNLGWRQLLLWCVCGGGVSSNAANQLRSQLDGKFFCVYRPYIKESISKEIVELALPLQQINLS